MEKDTKISVMGKKGNVAGAGMKYIWGFLIVIILFEVVNVGLPLLVTSWTSLNTTGLPFATLLSPTGLLGIIIGVGVFVVAYKQFMSSKK